MFNGVAFAYQDMVVLVLWGTGKGRQWATLRGPSLINEQYLVHKRFYKFCHNLWWWIVNDETDAITFGLLLEPCWNISLITPFLLCYPTYHSIWLSLPDFSPCIAPVKTIRVCLVDWNKYCNAIIILMV